MLRYLGTEAVRNIRFEQTTLDIRSADDMVADTNGDGIMTPADVLMVVNELERKNQRADEADFVRSPVMMLDPMS